MIVALGLTAALAVFLLVRSGEAQRHEVRRESLPASAASRPAERLAEPADSAAAAELAPRTLAPARLPDIVEPVHPLLAGRCVDGAGAPIARARVGLVPMERSRIDEPVVETSCDADGRFRFDDVDPLESYFVVAVADGRPLESALAQAGLEVELEFADDAALEGQVVDAGTGAPLPGAKVWAPLDRFPWHPVLRAWILEQGGAAAQTTDAGGGFRLDALRAGAEFAVFASHAGYVTAAETVELSAAGAPVRIELRPGTSVVFEVVDHETGAPIPGAAIQPPLDHAAEQAALHTDSTGRFHWTLDLVEQSRERTQVRVDAPGYCAVDADLQQGARAGQRIELVRGAVVTGTVLDPGGQPLARAEVQLLSTGDKDDVPSVKAVPAWQPFVHLKENRKVSTDATGEYRIEGVVPRDPPFTLRAHGARHRIEERPSVTLSTPGQIVHCDLQLVDAGAIEGRVTLAGAPVRGYYQAVGPDRARSKGWTGPAGSFRLEGLDPGPWRLAVFNEPRPRSGIEEQEPRVIEAGAILRWDVELAPDGLADLSGRVVFESGRPAVAAEVRATKRDGTGVRELTATTDAQGEFRMEAPVEAEASWTLNCRVGEASTSVRHVRVPEDEVELRLPDLGSVGLRIVEQGSGAPLELERLWWRVAGTGADWRSTSRVKRGADGIHTLQVPLGLADFRATTGTDLHLEGVLLDVPVGETSTQVWELELERGIELVLRFASETGVAGFPVSGPPSLESGRAWWGARKLEAPDQARYAKLRAATYTLWVQGGIAFTPASIELSRAPQQEFRVTWRIADPEAYEALRREYEEYERLGEAGLLDVFGY